MPHIAGGPPLDLFIEVTTPSGRRFKWDGNQPDNSRPLNLSFRSKLGEGFSDASLQLTRRIDLDYPDLNLLHDVKIAGADGSIAYEGRISAMPRESGERFSIGVTMAGWISHATDRKFTKIFADRDLGAWKGMSTARRGGLLTANITPYDAASSTDPTDSKAVVSTEWTGGWVSPYRPQAEAWYDAGSGNLISALNYSWKRQSASVSAGPDDWYWQIYASTDDKLTSSQTSGDLQAAGPANLQTFTSAPVRFMMLALGFLSTPISADGQRFGVDWSKLAVYGDHGIALTTGDAAEPPGVTASEVLKHLVTAYCPKLSIAGIAATSYAIPHLVFREKTTPYDAFLQINKYHLFHLGVWENRVLHFRPYDLTNYQWEIRTDDPGTTFAPQGESTENVFNAVEVIYEDLNTRVENTVTSATFPELADLSLENPWNQQGIYHPDYLTLTAPTLPAQAVQIGRAYLTERNKPKTPGTITVRGHIQDRQGNWQPVWKVRAGDLISVTNFPNDTPRLIHEVSYDDDQKSATLAIDAPAATLEAFLDRQGTALQAAGLS